MDIVVRKAKPIDFPIIQKLGTELMLSDRCFDPLLEKEWYISKAGTKYLLSRIKSRNRICLVAENNGEIIGYATGSLLTYETWRPIKQTELENLVITKKYRRHGAGYKLIVAFIKWSREKGAKRAKVLSEARNKDAICFYEDNGFITQYLTLETDI